MLTEPITLFPLTSRILHHLPLSFPTFCYLFCRFHKIFWAGGDTQGSSSPTWMATDGSNSQPWYKAVNWANCCSPVMSLFIVWGYNTYGVCFVQNAGLEGFILNFNLTVSTQKVYVDFYLNWRPKQLANGEKHQFFKIICLNLNDIFVFGIIQKLLWIFVSWFCSRLNGFSWLKVMRRCHHLIFSHLCYWRIYFLHSHWSLWPWSRELLCIRKYFIFNPQICRTNLCNSDYFTSLLLK